MNTDVALSTDEDIETASRAQRGGRILVVDDEPQMLRLIQLNLEQSGYDVEAVHGGADALESLHRRRPDLLITDVMMPEISGLDLLRAVRDEPDLARLPVILLTAREDVDLKLDPAATGEYSHLVKPFAPAELIAMVSLILG